MCFFLMLMVSLVYIKSPLASFSDGKLTLRKTSLLGLIHASVIKVNKYAYCKI